MRSIIGVGAITRPFIAKPARRRLQGTDVVLHKNLDSMRGIGGGRLVVRQPRKNYGGDSGVQVVRLDRQAGPGAEEALQHRMEQEDSLRNSTGKKVCESEKYVPGNGRTDRRSSARP